MRKALYIILAISAASCTHFNENNNEGSIDKQVDTTSFNEQIDTKRLKIENSYSIDSLVKINNEWVNYYAKRINDFSLDKFELLEVWTEKELINGNVFGDYYEGFNKNHEKFIVNSPDNKQYIDLDSYQINIEKNEAGDLILTGGLVDQEIDLVNRITKEVKRIDFFGPTAHINDAKWIDNNTLVLYGIMNDKLIIELILIKELIYYLYVYPTTIEEENYNMDVRLKDLKLE